MSTLGPLSTIFTPSPSCTSAGYTEFFNQNGGSYVVRGPVTTEGCFPSGFQPQTDYYYSPGQCPSGYTQGCASQLIKGTAVALTAVCCPDVESVVFACGRRRNSSDPLPNSFPCTQVISNTTSVLPITKVSDGSTLTTITSTITAATIGAYGITIEYSSDDKLEELPDPERFNKVRLAYTGQHPAQNRGLSPEAKVGVGVGACLAAGLIALGVVIFFMRKRGTQNVAACKHTVISESSTPSSTQNIRRKPVPSAHSSELSTGVPSGTAGYRALSASEVENTTDTGTGTGQSRAQRQKALGGVSLWAWEMLSLFTSVLSLASIIIVLDVYENRRLDEWKPIISINAVISILSGIFKGSLALPVTEGIGQLKWLILAKEQRALSDLDVYDKASRGAWGSAMMIFGQFKAESKAYLASFGALLVLIVLAADPFAQATISLYSCAQNGTDIASIPRANNYTVGSDFYDRVTAGTFNLPMQLALYRGILEPPSNSSASVSVSCTTGNCTFPEDGGATFTTLTMCSHAWDISERIEIAGPKNGYTYSLPGVKNSLSQGDIFDVSFATVPQTSFQVSEGDSWNQTSALDVYIVSMVKNNSTDCKPPRCTFLYPYNAKFMPSAFLFSLFPCVQTFSAKLAHGRYSERVISEQYLHFASTTFAGKYQLAMNRTMINGTWHECTGTEKPNETNTISVLLRPDDASFNVPHTWYSPECVFEFSGAGAMGTFLGETFFAPRVWARLPAWVSELWRNGTTDIGLVSQFAEGLATSIGAQMRTGAVGPSMLREARGTTLVEKTCIRIHWGYIAFFAVVFVLEVLFLGIVMVLSYRSKLHADWKSSILAVAFLSSANLRRGGWSPENPESEESLRNAAQSVKASLDGGSGTWQLRTQGPKF